MKSSNVIFLLIFTVCIVHGDGVDVVPGLYDKGDNVIILDDSNFVKEVIGSPSAWIIEFYNSWCGHCKRFAPTWKEIATEIKEWRPVISVAAVNCANKENTKLCRKYDVDAFPEFKLFPPFSSEDEKGKLFHEQEKKNLIHRMVDFISNSTAFEPPKSWPRLAPIISMEHIWDEMKDEHHHIVFVFEDADSYIGRQVILDTFQYKRLLVRRMLKDSVTKYGITTFPSMYRINKDASFTLLAKDDNTREGMESALKSLLSPEQLQERIPIQKGNQVEMGMKKTQAKQEPAAIQQEVRPGVYMRDLESTLHYSLRQEVAIHRDIEKSKLYALKQFVSLLTKYFPGRSIIVNYLERLSAWLKEEGTDMTGDHWLSAVDDIQEMDAYLPDRIQWLGCAGSEPHFRGYPCGMWTLFHVLTVSAYQKQRENPRDLPMEVLTVIQGYMKNFFGCKTCVEHFLKMADTLQPSDLHPRSAILWLWRAHNKANNRLHGDKTEDPSHPKVQFPPKSLCPKCYSGEEFIEDEVLTFLLNFYGKNSIIVQKEDDSEQDIKYIPTEKIDMKLLDWWERQQRSKDLQKIRDLRSKKSDKMKQKKDSRKNALVIRNKKFNFSGGENDEVFVRVQGWGFTNLDMGMCVLFYFLCTVIILVLYYHFIVRRKFKPCPFS